MANIITKILVILAVLSLEVAMFYYIRATVSYDITNDYGDINRDGRKIEIFGIIAIVLLFTSDVINLSLAPIP